MKRKIARDKRQKIKRLHQVCKIVFYGTLINFIVFAIIALILGGTASNSKIESGHYYLGDHGKFQEVPYVIFLYSQLHGLSLLISFPLSFVAFIVYWITGGEITRHKLLR